MIEGQCRECSRPANTPCQACRLQPDGYLAIKDLWLQTRPQRGDTDCDTAMDWAIIESAERVVACWHWEAKTFVRTAPMCHQPTRRHCWLEITTQCPHRCRHCFLGTRLNHGYAPLSVIHLALEQLPTWEVDEVVISGGEPTMHRDFLDILDESRYVARRVRVLTNGWTQRPEVIRALARPDVSVEIPLFGMAADHDWMTRTPGSFHRIRMSLDRYRAAGVNLTLTTTLTRRTRAALPALQELAEQLQIPLAPSALSHQGTAREHWDTLV